MGTLKGDICSLFNFSYFCPVRRFLYLQNFKTLFSLYGLPLVSVLLDAFSILLTGFYVAVLRYEIFSLSVKKYFMRVSNV